ncbi:DNA excision repair protein ERCC-6-like [Ambystoma mexicanum]|uniref:DNA excision repair protein ERCC-6-like n=1 Tax=Ambystoma mexicanum TaxID=8296 RepID=UPI0037E9AFC5
MKGRRPACWEGCLACYCFQASSLGAFGSKMWRQSKGGRRDDKQNQGGEEEQQEDEGDEENRSGRGGGRRRSKVAKPSSKVNGKQMDDYDGYLKQAKEETKLGNVEKSIELLSLANEINYSEKLENKIGKLAAALGKVTLEAGHQGEEFVEVLNSGLKIHKDLYNDLFEHQKEGVAFLYSLYRDERKGGVLADDMGLGKTIQIIAFVSGMFDAQLIRTILLVMPSTLIGNWLKEFARWTPGMRVNQFHGKSKAEREKNLKKTQRKGGIIITTYQMLIHNWEQLSSYEGDDFVWDYFILDEAHKIKTPSAKTTKCARNIPANNCILLTGTPVQNNLQEMWALFDFACQGTLLGTLKTFKMEYENPITRAREKDATAGEMALGFKMAENLTELITPFFLRRTKAEIDNNRMSTNGKSGTHEMPSLSRKNDFIIWVFLSATQEEIYRNFLELDEIKELLMTTRSPLAALTVIKKLCDHPRLLPARACYQLGLEGHEDDAALNEIRAPGEPEPTRIDHISDETLIEESGKMVFLVELLQRLQEEGHRTLVFSQSRKMLDIIDRVLTNTGFQIMRIDGTITSLTERERRITMFQNNEDYSVFLLTTQVGGVGITLTAADRVVIFDPSWNPATDAQAVDRAYRIGQTENVVIYRLITCATIEEKIYRRQVFKDSLIRQTTGDNKNPFRYFSKQELKALFILDDTTTSATQIQLQEMHSSERNTDGDLDDHIAFLNSLEIFGISDHDLMYTYAAEEGDGEGAEDQQYIVQRVQKAQELVEYESQLNGQLNQQGKNGGEDDGSRGRRGKDYGEEENGSRRRRGKDYGEEENGGEENDYEEHGNQ